MENEFPFLDMSHFTHSEQLNNMMPMITGVARPLQQPAAVRNNSSELYQQPNFHPRPSQPVLHSVSALPPSKIGKRQTNRQKYTDEDVQKICRMKESGMSWSKIAAEFPGRSQKSLQVSYCVNFKKRAEKFQDADREDLQRVVREEVDEMWERISRRTGKSVRACQQKVKEWGIQLR